MKKLIVLMTFIISNFIYAQTAEEILKKMDDSRNYPMHTATASMVVESKGRVTASMEYKFLYRKNSETDDREQLMTFTKPNRLNGTAILSKGDNVWYYNNRTKRVRLLTRSAKKGSIMGTSFSYEDLDMNYVNDFTAEILEDRVDYYIIKLVPKEEKNYSYIISKVFKSNYVEDWAEYYDSNGIFYKKLVLEDVRDMGGFWMEFKIDMLDVLRNKKTIVEVYEDSLDFNINFGDEDFSERRLKK